MITLILGMLLFAACHTLLAGQSLKQAFRKQFGDRAYYGFYRLCYNVLSVIMLIPIILILYLESGSVMWTIPDNLQPFALLIQFLGLIGALVSLLQINLKRFLGIEQAIAYFTGATLPLASEKLQTGGLYNFTRHPLYVFSLMAMWPVSMMSETLFVFNLIATIYFVVGSRLEERRLAQAFGDEYLDYKKRTAWLLPLPGFRR